MAATAQRDDAGGRGDAAPDGTGHLRQATWATSPEIAIRGTNNNDYHYPFRTYVNRARLIAANGDADNHVFWTQKPAAVSTLIAMDRWLAAVEADASSDPLHVKIVRNKPADIVTACWIAGVMMTDQASVMRRIPYFREPRTTAGEASTIYTMKCQLKPLDRADYNVTFTDAQWAAMQATFPTGVCDFSKPGVGFQPNASVADVRQRTRRRCRSATLRSRCLVHERHLRESNHDTEQPSHAFNGRSIGKHPWYVAMVISGFAVLGPTPTAAAAGPEIIVLSNRADLDLGRRCTGRDQGPA